MSEQRTRRSDQFVNAVVAARAVEAAPNRKPSSKAGSGRSKERLIWRSEFETLDQARREIADYIDRYHQRPHSGLGYQNADRHR